MSSWKKASKVNQKTPRERHQPESRAHLGLLEKKKDYKIRARDFQHKKRVIKHLKKQALNRNPDEFYFHMVNSKTVDGLHVEKKKAESEETLEQKLIMENKNITYVNMKRTIEKKKIDRLRSGLHLTDAANASKHVKYDSDGEEVPVETVEFDDSLLNSHKLDLQHVDKSLVNRLQKMKEKTYKQLARRIDRHKELTVIQEKMEVHRALKEPHYERPKLVKPATKNSAPVYQWKYERKR